MPLPHLRASRVRRPDVTALGGRRLIDFVDGQIFRSSQVGSLDLFDEFIAHCSKRLSAIGDFNEMDVGIEIVKGRQVRVTYIGGRIHTQEVDRVRPLSRRNGLGNLAVQNGPHPSKSREVVRLGILRIVDPRCVRGQDLRRVKSAGGNCQQFVSRFSARKRGSGALKFIYGAWNRSRAGTQVPSCPRHHVWRVFLHTRRLRSRATLESNASVECDGTSA